MRGKTVPKILSEGLFLSGNNYSKEMTSFRQRTDWEAEEILQTADLFKNVTKYRTSFVQNDTEERTAFPRIFFEMERTRFFIKRERSSLLQNNTEGKGNYLFFLL